MPTTYKRPKSKAATKRPKTRAPTAAARARAARNRKSYTTTRRRYGVGERTWADTARDIAEYAMSPATYAYRYLSPKIIDVVTAPVRAARYLSPKIVSAAMAPVKYAYKAGKLVPAIAPVSAAVKWAYKNPRKAALIGAGLAGVGAFMGSGALTGATRGWYDENMNVWTNEGVKTIAGDTVRKLASGAKNAGGYVRWLYPDLATGIERFGDDMQTGGAVADRVLNRSGLALNSAMTATGHGIEALRSGIGTAWNAGKAGKRLLYDRDVWSAASAAADAARSGLDAGRNAWYATHHAAAAPAHIARLGYDYVYEPMMRGDVGDLAMAVTKRR